MESEIFSTTATVTVWKKIRDDDHVTKHEYIVSIEDRRIRSIQRSDYINGSYKQTVQMDEQNLPDDVRQRVLETVGV